MAMSAQTNRFGFDDFVCRKEGEEQGKKAAIFAFKSDGQFGYLYFIQSVEPGPKSPAEWVREADLEKYV